MEKFHNLCKGEVLKTQLRWHKFPDSSIFGRGFDAMVSLVKRVEEAFAWEKRIQGWSHEKKRRFIEGNVPSVRLYLRERRER